MRRIALLLSFVTISVLPGCASARYATKENNRGVIAIPYDSEKNQLKAQELMAAHLPEGYIIEREEEVVTGKTTTKHTDFHEHQHGGHHRGSLTQTGHSTDTTRTRDQTEWRITYRSKYAAPDLPPEEPASRASDGPADPPKPAN